LPMSVQFWEIWFCVKCCLLSFKATGRRLHKIAQEVLILPMMVSGANEGGQAGWVGIFLFHQFFLALIINYAVRCRGLMLRGSLRCRSNMLRLNILHKPVPHSIQHCASRCAGLKAKTVGSVLTVWCNLSLRSGFAKYKKAIEV